jgi:hypothetical protein
MGPVLSLADVDLENDVFAERVPHDAFALLRREAPVHWYDWKHGRGFWSVTKHADVVAVPEPSGFALVAGGASVVLCLVSIRNALRRRRFAAWRARS